MVTEQKPKCKPSTVQDHTGQTFVSVDLPFVIITACRCETLHTIPCCQSFWTDLIIQCACVCLFWVFWYCFDICISKFWTEINSMAGLNRESGGTAGAPSPDSQTLLSECHLSTQEESARQSVQAPCLKYMCKDVIRGQDAKHKKHSVPVQRK